MRKNVIDHLGNEFENESIMCAAYNISEEDYQSRIKAGYSLEEALDVIPLLNSEISDLEVDENFMILNCIDECYFHCMVNGREAVYHHDEIIDYYREHVLQ